MSRLTEDQVNQLLKIAKEIHDTAYKPRWNGDYSRYQDYLTDGWFSNITWRDPLACDVRKSLRNFISLGDQLAAYQRMPTMAKATVSYSDSWLPEKIDLYDTEMEASVKHSINVTLGKLLDVANQLTTDITKLSFAGYTLKPRFSDFVNLYMSFIQTVYQDQDKTIFELEERLEKAESKQDQQVDYKKEYDILSSKNKELERSEIDKTKKIDELQQCVGYLSGAIQSALAIILRIPGSQIVVDILNNSLTRITSKGSIAKSNLTLFQPVANSSSSSNVVAIKKYQAVNNEIRT